MSMVGFYATTDPAADALLSTRSNPNNVAVNERGLRKYLVINSEVDQLIQEAKHHASIPHHQQHRNNSLILLNGFLALADYRSITLEATKQGDPLTDNTSIDLDQVWLSFNPELLARPYVPTWDQADMDWNVSG